MMFHSLHLEQRAAWHLILEFQWMLREEELQDMAEEMKVFNPSVLSQRTVGKRRENRKLGNESTRFYFPTVLREEGWDFDFNTCVWDIFV